MNHLTLRGTHREMGFQWGARLAERGLRLLDHVPFPLEAERRAFAAACRPAYARHFPAALEELEGLAAGQNCRQEDLETVLFTTYALPPACGCSCLAVSNGNGVFFGRNSDFLTALEPDYTHVTYGFSDRAIPFTGNTTSFVQMEDAVNARGLAIGLTSVYTPRPRPGLNAGMVLRLLAETCAAVPELESLIAMSRMFGVTIGALLGVEPEAAEDRSEKDAPEAPGEGVEGTAPAGELTDRELAAVEAIAKKYLDAAQVVQNPRWSRKKKIAVSAGICGAALTAALALGSGLSALGSRLDQVQSQVYGIESSVSGQIGALAGQIRDLLDEDSNLFAVSQARVTDYDLAAGTVTLQVSAQAKSWQDNTTALFTALLSDGRQFSAEASGKNGTFTAQNWTLPMDQEILLSASLTTDGVTAADQLETLYDCLPGNFRLDVWGGFSQTDWANQWRDFQSDSWPQTSKKLTLGGLSLSISHGGNTHFSPSPSQVEICFYRNQETVPESSVPVPEALELWAEAGFVEMYNWTDYTFTCELLPGETLTAAVCITDDHGQTTWTILCAYRLDQSGNVQTPQDLPADWQPGDLL